MILFARRQAQSIDGGGGGGGGEVQEIVTWGLGDSDYRMVIFAAHHQFSW